MMYSCPSCGYIESAYSPLLFFKCNRCMYNELERKLLYRNGETEVMKQKRYQYETYQLIKDIEPGKRRWI